MKQLEDRFQVFGSFLISVLTLFLIILRFYSTGGCNRTGSYYLLFLMNSDSILVPIVLSSVNEKYKESLATIEFPY